LVDYVLEKASSGVKRDYIFAISLVDIRKGPEHVTEKALKVPKGCILIINAAAESDMLIFVAGILAGK
jgi:hypothetical protein